MRILVAAVGRARIAGVGARMVCCFVCARLAHTRCLLLGGAKPLALMIYCGRSSHGYSLRLRLRVAHAFAVCMGGTAGRHHP